MSSQQRFNYDTHVVHTGYEFDQTTGAVSVPVYQVSTYRQSAPGRHQGYEYSRSGNPTRAALENMIAELEHGNRGLAFSSGLAALSTVFMLFNSGDHLVVSDDVYGGTYRLLTQVFSRLGLTVTFVDMTDLGAVEAAMTASTRAIFAETPTNPLMKVTDLRRLAEVTHQHNAYLIVDNTFMTPYYQNPLDLGADIVVHSATKYLGGHSDVVAGVAVTGSPAIGEQLQFLQNAVGAILGPQDSWLLMRGIKTLGVRMEKHEANALHIAQWLTTLPQVRNVYYPGLTSHPQYELSRQQARGFGGMVSFETVDSVTAEQLVSSVRLITLAESLGAVESLISLPAKMTHASIPATRRAELGISDRLVRLSVGIEHVADIQSDLAQAFNA